MRLFVLLGGVLIAAAGYFAVFGGDHDVFDVRRIRAERAAEEQRVADARAQVEVYRARRDSLLHDSATIERVAREQYGLIRDGERLYRFAEPPAPRDSAMAGPGSAPPPDSVPQD